MIPSKSSMIASFTMLLALSFTSPLKAFILAALIAPMPFFFFGLIIDKYPSKVAILSSVLVFVTQYFGLSWWLSLIIAISIGTIIDIYFKTKVKTK